MELNRRALLRAVRWMLSMLPEDGEVVTRGKWLSVLVWLRPAEAATRRLVAWMAMFVQVVPVPPREPVEKAARKGKKRGTTKNPSLPLFDPRTNPGPPKERRNGRKPRPNIRDILINGPLEDDYRPVSADDPVDASTLMRRIAAVQAALDDLLKLAERLARTYAAGRAKWVYPIRVGRPPGYRRRGRLPVHETLDNCNGLFWMAVRKLEAAERVKVPP